MDLLQNIWIGLETKKLIQKRKDIISREKQKGKEDSFSKDLSPGQAWTGLDWTRLGQFVQSGTF